MNNNSDDGSTDSTTDEISSEILTEVEFDDEPGTVYAVQRVEKGEKRVDWKIGHIDGTFAEGHDFYDEGEMFESGQLQTMPENGPSGRYKDTKFHELLDFEVSVEDGKMIERRVYDVDGVDTSKWAIRYLDGSFLLETILDEWWGDAWERHSKKESQ